MSESRLGKVWCVKCKTSVAWYTHPELGDVCKDCLETFFREVLKLPNWKV